MQPQRHRPACITPPHPYRDTSSDWEEALGKIAILGPPRQPADREFSNPEEAEAHGLQLGLWEAASIARRALADDREELPDSSIATYASLTESERDHLRALNSILERVERRFHPAAVEISRRLRDRVKDSEDPLSDYEVYLTIDFYLAEDDPAWCDEEDNLIGSVVERLTDAEDEPEFGFGAFGTNHAEPGRFPGEHHCWLYHEASDHVGLGWRDLLRVGLVWSDFIINEQTAIPVVPPAGCAATEEP